MTAKKSLRKRKGPARTKPQVAGFFPKLYPQYGKLRKQVKAKEKRESFTGSLIYRSKDDRKNQDPNQA
jgi:hypothetical protein